MHDWVVIALGVLVSILSGLIARLLRKLDDLEKATESHAIQIRDTRTAIAEARTALNLGSYPYTE